MADFEDPLGAGASVSSVEHVDPLEITSWGSGTDEPEIHSIDKTGSRSPPFAFDANINDAMSVWTGDIVTLRADAIIHSTNESLNENTALSIRIHRAAGSELKSECTEIASCRTGDVKVTKGYNLPAKFVFHTVGPRFNKRYRTAAESALFSCTRTTLSELRERGLITIGLSSINTPTRNYMTEDAAPIILRTIRRFLEQYGNSIKRIVLCLDEVEKNTYYKFLPQYFPRSTEEAEWSSVILPEDVGNEDGEPVIEERKIRIMEKPMILKSSDGADDGDENTDSDSDVDSMKTPFDSMTSDHDRSRREKLNSQPNTDSQSARKQKLYQALIRRAKGTDLTHISSKRICAPGGTDKEGRRVFSFACKNFRDDLNMDEVLMSILSMMDSVVGKPYIIVQYQTGGASGNNLLKEVLATGDQRYKSNLKQLYTVHSSMFGKISSWFSSAVADTAAKDKTSNLPGLRQLFEVVSPEHIDVPDYVWTYDAKQFGVINSQTGIMGAGEDL